jgi:hypothetical protein
MILKDAEDLASFVSELQRESDRGLPLVGGALIDELLQESLRAFFIASTTVDKLLDEATGPLATFSARSKTCFVLGLIDAHEYREVELIRKIRNEFAHAKHGKTFSDDRIRDLCFNLKSNVPEGYSVEDPRSRFISAVVAVVVRLYYRPKWVALERRQAKAWVPEDPRWRSVQEELPPDGVPVLGLAKDDQGNEHIVVMKRIKDQKDD